MPDMNTYEGACRYCGDVQPVLAMDQTDADEKITEQCSCGGAEMEKRKKRLLQNLRETVGQEAESFGYSRVSPEQENLITEMALAVLHGRVDSATWRFEGTTVNIRDAGGKIKIQRVDTKRAEKSV